MTIMLSHGDAAGDHSTGRVDIASTVRRIRSALAVPLEARRIASSIARAAAAWRDRENHRRRNAAKEMSLHTGFSTRLLDESIDALLRPFSAEALDTLVNKARHRAELVSFVMAGNAAGAGIHELVIALLAGAGVLIKSASSEPVFFAAFAETLREIDPELGRRIAVFNWSRENRELTAHLIASADLLVAYGNDSTIAALTGDRMFIGFGSRVSAAALAIDNAGERELSELAAKVAHDAALYEQLGCLSPHHVFIVGSTIDSARNFAQLVVAELERIANQLPGPAQIPLRDAAAIRRVREVARWRAIAGEPIGLFEGPRLSWTLIFDPDASFSVSPGYRTLFVSVVSDAVELVRRLDAAAPYLESLAIAADELIGAAIQAALEPFGIPLICKLGEMQSPPLEWRHGGGRFLDLMTTAR